MYYFINDEALVMVSLESASLAVWHATYFRAALVVGGIRRPLVMVSLSPDGSLLVGDHEFAHGAVGRLELEHHLGAGAMHADVEVHDSMHGREEHERLVCGLRVRFVRMTSDMRAYVDGECARPQRAIAVVDDDASQLWRMQAMLIALGFRVVGIGNPIGATNIIARSDVQLVLINLEMTGLDGSNLCRLLRHHPRTQGLAIVLHAGCAEDVLATTARSAGADGYVRRDVDTATFVHQILLHSRAVRAPSEAPMVAQAPHLVAPNPAPSSMFKPLHEKRSERRLTFLASWQLTELASGVPARGYTVNLSRGGVALYLNRQLANGSSVRLGVREDDSRPAREIMGTVRWVRRFEPFFATGISFNLGDEPARRAVGALVDGIDVAER